MTIREALGWAIALGATGEAPHRNTLDAWRAALAEDASARIIMALDGGEDPRACKRLTDLYVGNEVAGHAALVRAVMRLEAEVADLRAAVRAAR